MLRELRITNFTLVDDLDLELAPGLNVFTGETGAGKSMLLDAVGFLLGERAGDHLIGRGGERVSVEGVFDLSACGAVRDLVEERQLDAELPDELHMARELRRGGRTLYRINGAVCTAGAYREIGDLLVDVHGQHEHQSLLRAARHREILDRFAGDETLDLAARVARLHGNLRTKEQERARLEAVERERLRLEERYRFEADEIAGANLRAGELEDLLRERSLLANAEKIATLLQQAWRLMEDGECSAATQLSAVERICVSLSKLAEGMDDLRRDAEELVVRTQELAREIARFVDAVEMNPARLEQVEERLDLIRTMMKKYGDGIEEIEAYRKEAAEKLAELEGAQALQASIAAECEDLGRELREKAGALSRHRRDASGALSAAVVRELRGLEMKSADFAVQVEPSEGAGGIGPSGCDRVEFLIATNPGEALRPLSQVASGGELSRIMLALKGLFAEADQIPVLIFDEIDAGLGGRTAQAVAMRLQKLARVRQVLCVTHLPIIAAQADVQFHLCKEQRKGATRIRAHRVEGAEREREIARMLAGRNVTPTTLAQARELLATEA